MCNRLAGGKNLQKCPLASSWHRKLKYYTLALNILPKLSSLLKETTKQILLVQRKKKTHPNQEKFSSSRLYSTANLDPSKYFNLLVQRQ